LEEIGMDSFPKRNLASDEKVPIGRIWRIVPAIAVLILLLASFRAVAWFDDVESGENGWIHYWISNPTVPDNWAISTSRWHSPSHSWHSGTEVANWVSGGDTALESPPIDISGASASYFNFWHWYDFDYVAGSYRDGGIVEINNGSGWQQISPTGGYDDMIATGNLNPLEGLSAFVGNSSVWQYETFDISPFVGNVVRIRFHVGWDYGTTGLKEGWYVDDIEITNSTLPQHDLIIGGPNVPPRLFPYTNISVGGSVRNNGMNDETNVTVNLTADGVRVDNTTIGFLQNGTVQPVTLYWQPTVEKTYNLCLEVTPVPGENVTLNNKNCLLVDVYTVKGSILVDQTHNTDDFSYYSIFLADLIAEGYEIHYQNTTPITSLDLAGHDVFIIPQARMSYVPSELTAIQNFVSSSNGLFVIGDDDWPVYASLTSFVGITWLGGGMGGITTSITPHEVTMGVTAVQLPSPMCHMSVSGPAISLVRDLAGQDTVTVSSPNGRVAGICDEGPLADGGIVMLDNEQLALNIVEWLLGVVYEHDIGVFNFNSPKIVDPGVSFYVNASIKNFGMKNETNVIVDFNVNSVLEDNLTIPSLITGVSQDVSFNFSSTVEGYYDVEISVRPVPNENFTLNNNASKTVHIGYAVYVAIYDHPITGDISYFFGGNSNYYSAFQTMLDSDPANRFVTEVITDLSSSTLYPFDVLLLPDNAVPDAHLSDVADFFANRKGIVGVDSAVCYMAYSGFLWPASAGSNGASVYWDYNSRSNDQEVILGHEITADYVVGNSYSSVGGEAQMYISLLSADAFALTSSQFNPTFAYVVAREEPGSGRVVELGPFSSSPLSMDIHEMVRDAVHWASNAIPMEHDIMVYPFQLPKYIQPNDNVTIDVKVKNVGMNNETNIEVNFSVDGAISGQKNITSISSDQTETVTFNWVPTAEKVHTVCVRVTPIPNENITTNNEICRNVVVKKILAFILFDQTHGCMNIMSYYSALRSELISSGYAVDTLTTTPLTSSALSGYDVLVLPEPSMSYTTAERSAMQTFVSSGHGLLLMGDWGTSAYSDITSFAGIYWTSGGLSGTTLDITPHDVTKGVVSVYMSSPGRRLLPSGFAISLVRDRGGGDVLAVSEIPGRVGAFSDEYAFSDWDLNTSDNRILAMNLLEWLVGKKYEHDIAVYPFQLPKYIQPNDNVTIDVTVRNVGMKYETNIRVYFTEDGALSDQNTIPTMSPGQTNTVTFNWVPTAEKVHNICMGVTPIPNENITTNNEICRNVVVRQILAFILFDQTHGCMDIFSFHSALRSELISNGYVVDTLTTTPLTSSALSGYDVLVLPEPTSSYALSERSAMQTFVSSGHGLLLMGDWGTSAYSDITSFAGITWTSGGSSGVTFDISPHEVTLGVTSVYLPSPGRRLITSSPAIGLVRDVGGRNTLAVSESPGRVGAFSDESAFTDGYLNTSDNRILAINLLEWLVGKKYEHDIKVKSLIVPPTLERWLNYTVQAEIENVGLNSESYITVNFTYDGVTQDSTVISHLASASSTPVSFNLTPSSLGDHSVGVEVAPVQDENITINNILEQQVLVRDTKPPMTPTNLQVKNTVDPSALELTWTPNTEPDLVYYIVYMSLDGFTYYFEALVFPPFSNFTDSGLLQGNRYYYRVSASDDVPNESPPSSPAIGIPGVDLDNDGILDMYDQDDDNDGVLDEADDFPRDPTEWKDTDGDGVGDNADEDDDGDGVPDINDAFPRNPYEYEDSDLDGIGDNLDPDDDNDGILDDHDDFPKDPNESVDTDGDGIGDNADVDDDNDGVLDVFDDLPKDPYEWIDTDLDGLGDNRDPDDDNDGYSDVIEEQAGSDPKDPLSVPDDTDGDGIIDLFDEDDDNDGYSDVIEEQAGSDPKDPLSVPDDTDGDGMIDMFDGDDDNDGYSDVVEEQAGSDPKDQSSVPVDTDGDGIIDMFDGDDDNDGYSDVVEEQAGSDPKDPHSVPVDTDGDGIIDIFDEDDDGDGVYDGRDAFPLNPNEWVDTDGDGLGNNADPDDDNDGILDNADPNPLITTEVEDDSLNRHLELLEAMGLSIIALLAVLLFLMLIVIFLNFGRKREGEPSEEKPEEGW
jgi:hypothetical protein